ncbi:DUF1801 domain-containing protein [Sediminibacterium ginsengisoli]|uniref:Uncharacterized protein n=1 Tax=Sediminibacterium ginsengisoli TaxID=413434 RepID=A0A1T4RN99_9BACT|nr:DUF1801 domain-containing protein [Sediminibacterium ginsengisoli]SKA17413.1 protein of unknown function (DU1801) [Sediminibacterium ginsengisoli]
MIVSTIREHIDSLPEPRRTEMNTLHAFIKKLFPKTKLWFDEGKDASGKVVTNPTIGYGLQTIRYTNGKTRDYFQIGIRANTSGISVYILGLADKTYLANTYGKKIGKAKVTGYCIKFKTTADIDLKILGEAIQYGVKATAIS